MKEFVVPHLTDSDIDGLIQALDRENLLGKLKGLSARERVAAFKVHAERQLLVAMMEATSGEKFEKKLVNEWEQLESTARYVYALACIAHSYRHSLSRTELLQAAGELVSPETSNETLNAIQALTNRHLLVSNPDTTHIRCRHRFLAETLRDELAKSGNLHPLLARLAFVISIQVVPTGSRNTREWRFMRDLLNHDRLMQLCRKVEHARAVFDAVAGVLSWNYQYYLQAGSLEVEAGDVQRAENLLRQAYSMEPSDTFVQTEYAYMLLTKAIRNGADPGVIPLVDEAFRLLRGQIATRGKEDGYPYHVLGSQGLSWSRKGPLSVTQRQILVAELLTMTIEGVRNHPKTGVLKQLEASLRAEQLELGRL